MFKCARLLVTSAEMSRCKMLEELIDLVEKKLASVQE